MANIPEPPIVTETIQADPSLNPITTGTRGGLRLITPAGNGDANIDTDISNIAKNLKREMPPVSDETQTSYGGQSNPGGTAETIT